MRDVANLENQVDWLRDRILSFLHRVAAEDLTLEDGEDFINTVKAGATMESYTEGLPETDKGKPVETAPVRGARLKSSAAEGVKQYRLEYDLMEALKRIRRHLHRARVQLETSENSYADMDEDRAPEAA